MKYFFVKLSICHRNKTFNKVLIENYLVSKDFQFRKLISEPEDFEYMHTKEVELCRNNKQMLLRAKYKDTVKSFIEIISVWDQKRNFNKFFKKSKGTMVHNLLRREGFQVQLHKKYIDDNFMQLFIQKLKNNPQHSKIEFNDLNIY